MTDVEVLRHLPGGVKQPATVAEAIGAAIAILDEEAYRWRQGAWFDTPAIRQFFTKGKDDELYKQYVENPYCGSWQACMMGAVRIGCDGLERHQGIGGITTYVFPYNHHGGVDVSDLYYRTEAFLDGRANGHGHHSAIGFNDAVDTTRDDVLKFLREAKEAAESAEL